MSAATEAELLAKVSEHVRKVHRVRTTTNTIASFVRATMRQR